MNLAAPASLPPGWAETKLSDLVTIVRGITFPTDAKRHEFSNGHIACLRTTNVQRDVDLSSLWFVPRKYMKNEQQVVRPYDILISTANSFELVGKNLFQNARLGSRSCQ